MALLEAMHTVNRALETSYNLMLLRSTSQSSNNTGIHLTPGLIQGQPFDVWALRQEDFLQIDHSLSSVGTCTHDNFVPQLFSFICPFEHVYFLHFRVAEYFLSNLMSMIYHYLYSALTRLIIFKFLLDPHQKIKILTLIMLPTVQQGLFNQSRLF